ncbi:hypothetical protein TNCV_291851 [Trichonephila clavipes]|nr:hypothetical protein TNCV_291851 [Trichonephila clavipes]
MVPISVFVTLGTEVHEQMFRSGGQSDMKVFSFLEKALCIHLYSLKGRKAESTMPSPGFEPRICGMEA